LPCGREIVLDLRVVLPHFLDSPIRRFRFAAGLGERLY
jgi:hypothetical protein